MQCFVSGEHIKVVVEDVSAHPLCPHGPTLLFQRILDDTNSVEEFFACAAYRNPKECSFRTVKKDAGDSLMAQSKAHLAVEHDISEQDEILRKVN